MIVMVFWVCFLHCLKATLVYTRNDSEKSNLQTFKSGGGKWPRNYSKIIDTESVTDCNDYSNNQKTPFIVLVLYKSSGNFIGMGSILDRRTVITSEKVVEPVTSPSLILVLAGSLSPWWGKDSQVRTVNDVLFHKYEVILLKMNEDWVFNKNVAPINLPKKFYKYHTPVFGKHAVIYGIVLAQEHQWAEAVPKSEVYSASLNRAVHEHWTECKMLHKTLKAQFSKKKHYCFYPNDSFCHGSIGSPSVGITKMGEVNIVGIIIRTACRRYDLVVKISYLDRWIRSNSLLGHQMIDD